MRFIKNSNIKTKLMGQGWPINIDFFGQNHYFKVNGARAYTRLTLNIIKTTQSLF